MLLGLAPAHAKRVKIHKTHFEEVGIASWYGGFHKGRKTFSEEIFDPQANTCAHRTLPMHSIVEVKDIKTGNSILCRVNDRGPFVSGRIVDLSQKCAERLGITNKGIVKVTLKVLRVGPL